MKIWTYIHFLYTLSLRFQETKDILWDNQLVINALISTYLADIKTLWDVIQSEFGGDGGDLI